MADPLSFSTPSVCVSSDGNSVVKLIETCAAFGTAPFSRTLESRLIVAPGGSVVMAPNSRPMVIAHLPVPAGHRPAAAPGQILRMREDAESADEKARGVAPSLATKEARVRAREAAEKALTQEHKAFQTQVRTRLAELEKCGQEYVTVNPRSQAFVTTFVETLRAKTPTEDDKKTIAALVAYMDAQRTLVAEITTLSKDIETQRYASHVINRYFLVTGKVDGKPVAPAAAAPAKK